MVLLCLQEKDPILPLELRYFILGFVKRGAIGSPPGHVAVPTAPALSLSPAPLAHAPNS